MKRISLAILIIISWSALANATSYYIDCAGNNSNNGTSTLTPWADFTPTQTHNFLQPGDTVNVKTGCTFSGTSSQAYIYSTGTATSPIEITTYGGGADPIFDASNSTSSVPGWSGWTSYDGPNNVWVSNVTIPWAVNGVIIDGTSNLKKFNPEGGQNLATLSTTAGIGMFMQPNCFSVQGGCAANQLLYLRLTDNSDPNGHTIRFNHYGNGDSDAHARGQFGVHDSTEQYINIHHMSIKGSNTTGFTSGAPYVNFYNCTNFASAREGFYIVKNAVQNLTGGSYDTINSSDSSYANSNFGQQYTIEAPHVDLIDVNSEYGWMAGIDWLDYNSSTDASYGRCIRCISHDNSMRAIHKDPNGFDPGGIYIDGGHDIQIIDSVFYLSLAGYFPTATAANAIYLVSLQTEHPSTKPDYNIDIVNSLVYNSNFCGVQNGAINCSGSACNVDYNINIVGNTVDSGSGDKALCLGAKMDVTKRGIYLFNNIIRRPGGGQPLDPTYTTPSMNGDYNVWFDNNGSSLITATQDLPSIQGSTGQEMHSLFANPTFTGASNPTGITNAYHLSSIAAGQGSNSPALGIAFPNYLGTRINYTSIGSVRTDGISDSLIAPASGFHYLSIFFSSYFSFSPTGTTYANVILSKLVQQIKRLREIIWS